MSDLLSNINQFEQGNLPGTIDLSTNPNPSVIYCRIDPNGAAADFVAGQGVRLVDAGVNDGAGPPLVDALTVDTQVPFGVILFDPKQGTHARGDVVAVAVKRSVVNMQAAAALNRGSLVSLTVATAKEVAAVGANAQFGYLLDKASAAGDLVRVLITTEGV